MAEDRVDVIFGARIGELVSGVNEVKEKIEGLRAPVESFVGSLQGISEAVGLAFAVEKIAEFAEKIPEVAERTANMAAAIGTTTEAMSEFQNVMYAATGQQEGMGRVIERLGKQVQTALGDPLSDQRRAFQNLGISMEELKTRANDPIAVLDLLRERFSALNQDANRSTNFYEILSRGMERLVPYLRQPAEKIAELRDEVSKTGANMDANFAEKAEETATKMRLLTEAVTGFGRAVFEAFTTPINFAVDQLTKLLEIANKIVPAMKGVITNATPPKGGPGEGVIEGVIGSSPGANALIPTEEEQKKLDFLKNRESGGRYDILHGPGGKPSGTITDFSKFPDWEGFMGPTGRSRAAGAYGFQPGTYAESAKTTGLTDFSPQSQDQNALALLRQKGMSPWPGAEAAMGSSDKASAPPFGAAGQTRKDYEAQLHTLDLEQAKNKDNFTEWEAIEQKKIALIKQYGQDSSTEEAKDIEAQRRNAAEALAIKVQQFSTFEAFNKAQLASTKASLEQEVALGKIEKSAEIADLQNMMAQQHAEEENALQVIRDNNATTTKEREALNNKLIKLDAEYEAKRAQLEAQYTIEVQKENTKQLKIITDGFDTLGKSAISAFNGLLLGQQTWANSAKKLYTDVGNWFLTTIEEMGAKWAASGLASTFGGAVQAAVAGAQSTGGTGLGAALAALIGPLIGLTTTATSQTAATLTNTVALTANTVALGASAAGGAIGGLGGGASAALMASLLVLNKGGIVPSAAGGWQLPSLGSGGTLANLHSNEMVLPSNISQGFQNMFAGGGGPTGGGHTFNMNISAMDAQSVMRAGPALVNSINQALRNGASLRSNGSY